MTTATDTATDLRTFPREGGGTLRRLLFAFLITLIAGIAFSAAFVLGYGRLHEGQAMPGVSVAGVSIGGLDRAAAEARIREQLPRLDAGTLTVTIGTFSQRISYAALGRDYDLAPILDHAFQVGRTGTVPEQVSEQLTSLTHGIGFSAGMRYDQAALDGLVTAASRSVETPAVDATVTRTDTGFVTTPSSTGLAVDEAAVRIAATQAIAGTATGTADVAISVEPTVLQPIVTTLTVETAAATATAMSANAIHMTAKGKSFTIPPATIRGWVGFSSTVPGFIDVTLDTSGLPQVIQPFAKGLLKPAVSASFAFKSGKVVPVPGADGEALDVNASVALVDGAIRAQQAGGVAPTVPLAIVPVQPDYTTAQAIADAPKMKRVSFWNTFYPVSDHNFFGNNIRIPTATINGYVLQVGRTFDFWKAIGEVSRRTGYGPGGAIINGHTQPTGALAGGICSCSTTLFNAALRFGLEMGARRNHYYYIIRYPLGLDATVFKSNGGSVQTMSFKNDTAFPILIRGINSYGKVRFELWSQPTGRTVTLSQPIVRNVTRATEETGCTTQLRPGQRVRVEFPADGKRVWVTRTVTDATGAIIHKETYRSNYNRVNGMTLFGKPVGYTGPCAERLPA